jgi:hypothetical protein
VREHDTHDAPQGDGAPTLANFEHVQ